MNEAREQELIKAGREAEQTGDVESLKRKYSGTDEKIYTVTTTVQVDDDTEEEFSYLFRKPIPIAHKAALELLLGILYSFFTDVVSASPSIRSSLSARLIVIAGYSSTVFLSSSLCSSMMLSKTKLLDAFVTELEMVFTYRS